MKNNTLPSLIKDACLTAPSVIIITLSSIYQLMNDIPESEISLLMSILTAAVIAATLFLCYIWRRLFPSAFLSVLFGLTLLSHIQFAAAGGTDLFEDGFVERIMLLFAFPAESYSSLFYNGTSLPVIAVTATLFVLSLATCITVSIKIKNDQKQN